MSTIAKRKVICKVSSKPYLTLGKEYDLISWNFNLEKKRYYMFHVLDDSGHIYAYSTDCFEELEEI